MVLPQLHWLHQFPDTLTEVCGHTAIHQKMEDIEQSIQDLSKKMNAHIAGKASITISKDGEISIDNADSTYQTTDAFIRRLEKLEQDVETIKCRLRKVEQAVRRLENEVL